MGKNNRKFSIFIIITLIILPNYTSFLKLNQTNLINKEFLNFALVLNTLQTKLPNNYLPIPEDPSEVSIYTANGESDDSAIFNLTVKNFTNFHKSSQNVTYGYGNLNLTDNSGIFQGKYNFKNDNLGGNPNGWTVDESSQAFINITSEIDGHKKVVDFYDNDANAYTYMNQLFTNQQNGTIEYYVRGNKADSFITISLRESASARTLSGICYFDGNMNFYHRFDNLSYKSLQVINPNTWYHIRMEFDTTSDTSKYWIDGEFKGEYENFASTTNMNEIHINTGTSAGEEPFNITLDALDYSWENNYYENRNLNLESNSTSGYYISKDIPLFYNSTIYSYSKILGVNITSENQPGINTTLEYYDFNTDTWLNLSDYIGTTQNLFKFRVNFNTTCYSNAFLYNLTLHYNTTPYTIDRPIYLNQPRDIAIDDKEYIYVADTLHNKIKKFDSDGNFILEWGTSGSKKGQFNHPIALDISAEWTGSEYKNYIYVADYYNNRIQKFDENGIFVLEWGSYGGPDEGAKFKLPIGITIYSPRVESNVSPTIYVADSGNKQIQKFFKNGDFDNLWQDTDLSYNFKIAVNKTNHIYVADVERDEIRTYDRFGNLYYVWGKTGDGDGEFSKPSDIAFDNEGKVHVLDSYNNRIQKFNFSGECINESTWGSLGTGEKEFNFPSGLLIDNETNYYVVDTYNYRIQKFNSTTDFLWEIGKIIPELEITTQTYKTEWGNYENNTLISPRGIAIDSEGNQYVCDSGNNTIIKYDKWGHFLKKWGNGNPSSEFIFNNPRGIAIDSDGYIYVANSGNNSVVIFTDSAITDSFYKWGNGTDETFNFPEDLEVFTNSNNETDLYVVDKYNQRVVKFRILKDVNRQYEGYGLPSYWYNYEMDDEIISFKEPYGITINTKGHVYISDRNDTSVIKFDSDGKFLLKVGGNESDIFDNPTGLGSDLSNNIYIVDTNSTTGNHTIIITTNSFCYIKEITINYTLPLDVEVDNFNNVLIAANDSILKYTYLDDFPPLLSILNPTLSQGYLNSTKTPVFDETGNIYVLEGNKVYKFSNYGDFIKTFDTGIPGNGTEIRIKNFDNGESYLYHALRNDTGHNWVTKFFLDGTISEQIEISGHLNLSSIAINDNGSLYHLTESGITKHIVMENIYHAIYNFKDVANNSNHEEWDNESTGGWSYTKVIDELGNHSKVYRLHDGGDASWAKISNNFTEITAGTVEFYIRSTDVTRRNIIYINDGAGEEGITLALVADSLQYRTEGSWHSVCPVSDNTWYHLKVVFNITSNEWYLYLNGVCYKHDISNITMIFRKTPEAMDRIIFRTDEDQSIYDFWIDAVDYSWADLYYEGRNTYFETNSTGELYNASGEISSEGGKNQNEIDSAGKIFYLSHSKNEILKIDWDSQEILENWTIDSNLTEHQFFIDNDDNVYLLNKLNQEAEIFIISNESQKLNRYEFSYNESEEISISTDDFSRLYLFRNPNGNETILYKYGVQEITPELTFQITDYYNWTDIAINSTGFIFALDSKENDIEIYNPTGYKVGTVNGSQLDSPSQICIDRNNSLIVIDSQNMVKILGNSSNTFNTTINETSLEFIDLYVSDRIFILAEDQDGNFSVRAYTYNLTCAELNYSTQNLTLTEPTSFCVITENNTDRILVVDFLENEIKEFNETGDLKKHWGKFGSMAGEFIGPLKIANNSYGDLFVIDIGNLRIQKFDSEGNFKSEWGNFDMTLAQNILESKINVLINRFNDIELYILDSLGINLFQYEYSEKESASSDRTFVKEKIIDSGATYGVPQIYAIIYDPPGRDSYGYIERGSSWTITRTFEENLNVKMGHQNIVEIAGNGFESDNNIEEVFLDGGKISIKVETNERITSSQSNIQKYIGPGHGDTIWGE
ncbi:MAG: hypothetical protein HWN67_23600, partial [Candidatus Helarchaeota archaeon]|nr:hypothetical protein [Candidatus Helarchaeota archaeon]